MNWRVVVGVILVLVLLGYGVALLAGLPLVGQLAAAFIVPAVAGFVRGIIWLGTGR